MSSLPRKRQRTLHGHQGAVLTVKFSFDGSYCLSGASDRAIKLWNPHRNGPNDEEGFLVKTYTGLHGYEVQDISITEDNSKFASCGGDKAIFLWDVGTGKPIRRFQGHTHRVNAVDINKDASVILSASYDKTVRCWDVRAQNSHLPIQVLDQFKDSVTGVIACKDQIIASSVDGHIRTFDLRAGKLYQDDIHEGISSITMSHDGNCVVATCLDNTVRLLEKDSGDLLNEYLGLKCDSYKIQSCLSYNDEFLLSGSEDGKIYCWDLVEGELKQTLSGHSGVVSSVDYHPKRHFFVAGAYDGTVSVWG